MIRVAIVDDHQAVRLGLHTAIRSEPGLIPVGSAANSAELAPLLYRSRPDIVLLDYNLPDADGLTVCRDIKAQALAPGVILYSAFADSSMTVPAIVAGADGILTRATRLATSSRRSGPWSAEATPCRPSPATSSAPRAANRREDLPILGMLINRTPTQEIADTLRVDHAAVKDRIGRMLSQLATPVRPRGQSSRSPASASS